MPVSKIEKDDLLRGNAIIRYVQKIDPEELSPDNWAKLHQESLFIIQLQQKIIWGENQET